MSDNTNEIILEVKDLKKSFGDHVVLESINTTVRKVMYYSMSRILQIRV